MATRLDKLLEVCNAVREAGGGDTIEALLPSVPEDPKACLIARNLNFSCRIEPGGGYWYMSARKSVLEAVAPVLKSKVERHPYKRGYRVKLPRWMGKLADDFDYCLDNAEEGKATTLLRYISRQRLIRARAQIRRDIKEAQESAKTTMGDSGYWRARKNRLASAEAKLTQAIEAQA